MHVLTVLDHPDPNSLSKAVAEHFMQGAQEAGHTTELADLNAEGFNPLWTMADADGSSNDLPDIKKEQARIDGCDAICLVFPLFWWGMPSMMKGWVDRVWSWGWAYDQLDELDQSLQPARPGVLLVPAGGSSDQMDNDGYREAMETMWMKGTFGFFGFSPRKLELLCGATGSEARRKSLLQRSFEIGQTIHALDTNA